MYFMDTEQTKTKERPIPFSGPMVRAILEGRKTQARIVMTPQPERFTLKSDFIGICPYGQPGDMLWVRESWAPAHFTLDHQNYAYRADGEFPGVDRWRPLILMPRHVSRITLELTGVRVERVQDIKHRDALAEGVAYDVSQLDGAPVQRFKSLWDSTNGKSGHGWNVNPLVWVIEFKKL
jgi:hypothetical protein